MKSNRDYVDAVRFLNPETLPVAWFDRFPLTLLLFQHRVICEANGLTSSYNIGLVQLRISILLGADPVLNRQPLAFCRNLLRLSSLHPHLGFDLLRIFAFLQTSAFPHRIGRPLSPEQLLEEPVDQEEQKKQQGW